MSDLKIDSMDGPVSITIDGVERGRYKTKELVALHFGWLMQRHDELEQRHAKLVEAARKVVARHMELRAVLPEYLQKMADDNTPIMELSRLLDTEPRSHDYVAEIEQLGLGYHGPRKRKPALDHNYCPRCKEQWYRCECKPEAAGESKE